jgi:hypothetical protein
VQDHGPEGFDRWRCLEMDHAIVLGCIQRFTVTVYGGARVVAFSGVVALDASHIGSGAHQILGPYHWTVTKAPLVCVQVSRVCA